MERLLFLDFKGNLKEDPNLDLRMRLTVEVEKDPLKKVFKGGQMQSYEEMMITDYHVINDVVIDRGPSPNATQIEIYIDGSFFTTCIGDG